MSRNFASSVVPISPSSGLNVNAYIALKDKPIRQEQKLRTLRKYIKKYTTGWKKHLELADLLYEMGRWSEAVFEYYQVIEIQPQLIEPHIQLGKILQLMKRKEEAIAVYEQAIFLAKKEATKQHLFGLIKHCQGDDRDAIAALKLATDLEPKNLVHWLALGQIQMKSELSANTLLTFETILSIDPNNLMGLVYGYDLLLVLGNFSEAEIYLKKAVEVAPQDIQTLKRLIKDRCRKKLVFKAEGRQTKRLINSLLKQAPSSTEAHNLLAQYFILRGETDRGIQILKQLTEEYSHNPHAWYYYSQSLFSLGKHEAAATAIVRAYELAADDNQKIYRALCEIFATIDRFNQYAS